ncbi:MAG: hypothetical protein LBD24_00225 [Spirochaetaceae bacterium]|nr:hypothetical protein [Spirochaetaceae bacterium]
MWGARRASYGTAGGCGAQQHGAPKLRPAARSVAAPKQQPDCSPDRVLHQ